MTRVLADYGESLFNQSKAHSGPDEQPATSAGEIAEPCTLLFGEDDDLGDHGEFYEDDAGEGPFEPLLRHVSGMMSEIRHLP
jgi:hypothetical protein